MISIVTFQLCMQLFLIFILRVFSAKQGLQPPGETSCKLQGLSKYNLGISLRPFAFSPRLFRQRHVALRTRPVAPRRDALQGCCMCGVPSSCAFSSPVRRAPICRGCVLSGLEESSLISHIHENEMEEIVCNVLNE